MKNVGYLLNTKEHGLEGENGVFYDYLLASNGVFFHAKNNHLEAVIPISSVPIRGLATLAERDIKLIHGKIPRWMFDVALSVMWARQEKENEVLIVWGTDSQYHIVEPIQEGAEAHIDYSITKDIVLDMHNHTSDQPFFSGADNADDQGFKISMVLTNLHQIDEMPTYLMRLCCYGYFCDMDFEEVFE